MKKRIIAIFLVIAALITVLPCAAFADSAPHYKNYVALGDSIPAGATRLPGYYRGVQGFLQGAYPAVLKKMIGASDEGSFAGALCGVRVYELLILLYDEYGGDDYTDNFFSKTWANPLDTAYLKDPGRRAQYREAIRNADLITMHFGSNEIFGVFTYACQKYLFSANTNTQAEKNAKAALHKAEQTNYSMSAVSSLVDALKQLGAFSRILSDVTRSISQFRANWDLALDRIYELNPDVDVVAVSTYNPQIEILDFLFENVNNQMRYGSRYAKRYKYVDITPFGDMARDGMTNDGNHPDYAGHQYIAQTIYNALASYKHCDHAHTFTLGKIQALLPGLTGYTGDVYCRDCGKRIQQGQVVTYCDKNIDVPRNILPTVIGSISNKFASLFQK